MAFRLHADVLPMDDGKGVIAAERQGLNLTGTPGVLDVAAERGLIDFAQAVPALKLTTFKGSGER